MNPEDLLSTDRFTRPQAPRPKGPPRSFGGAPGGGRGAPRGRGSFRGGPGGGRGGDRGRGSFNRAPGQFKR